MTFIVKKCIATFYSVSLLLFFNVSLLDYQNFDYLTKFLINLLMHIYQCLLHSLMSLQLSD